MLQLVGDATNYSRNFFSLISVFFFQSEINYFFISEKCIVKNFDPFLVVNFYWHVVYKIPNKQVVCTPPETSPILNERLLLNVLSALAIVDLT
jgi:hypothetical protein